MLALLVADAGAALVSASLEAGGPPKGTGAPVATGIEGAGFLRLPNIFSPNLVNQPLFCSVDAAGWDVGIAGFAAAGAAPAGVAAPKGLVTGLAVVPAALLAIAAFLVSSDIAALLVGAALVVAGEAGCEAGGLAVGGDAVTPAIGCVPAIVG